MCEIDIALDTAMDDLSKFSDKRAAIRSALNVTNAVYSTRGINIAKEARQWADRYLKALAKSGAGFEIRELVEAGCKKLPLAASVKIGLLIATIPEIHSETLGGQARIEKLSRDFESTALLFDGISRNISFDGELTWPFAAHLPSPDMMSQYLRLYRYINFVPQIYEAMNVRTSHDIERFIPTAFVKKTTGDWHDREVAAVLQAATGKSYDEESHRKWRNRHYSKIAFRPEIIWDIAEELL